MASLIDAQPYWLALARQLGPLECWTLDCSTGRMTWHKPPGSIGAGSGGEACSTLDEYVARVVADDASKLRSALDEGIRNGRYSVEYRISSTGPDAMVVSEAGQCIDGQMFGVALSRGSRPVGKSPVHDLRNVLGVITNAVYLLRRRVQPHGEPNELLGMIEEELKTGQTLLERMRS